MKGADVLLASILTSGDYLGLGAMLTSFLAVPVTLIVFNLRTLSRRVEVVEKGVRELMEAKVSHKDWVRVVVSAQNRQNRMSEQLASLTAKIDASIGINAGLSRIGNVLEQHAKAG